MRLLSIRQLRFAALIAGIGLLVVMLPQAHEIESRVGLNALFHLRGVTAPPNDVVIIAINRSVATALDLPASPDRWPRSVYAQLIDRLAEAGASVIAIDLLFRDATERVSDTRLAESIARAGNVVLLEKVLTDKRGLGGEQQRALLIEQQLLPLKQLADAAMATAPFILPKVPVQVQQTWLFKEGIDTPTLPMVVFQIHAGLGEVLAGSASQYQEPKAANAGGLREAMWQFRQQRQAPVGASHARLQRLLDTSYSRTSASRYLNFYGPAGSIRTLGADHVLAEDRAPAELDLQGRIVFVGYVERNQQEQSDNFYTVYSSDDGVDLPGVEIAATTVANQLSDSFVEPLALGWQAALVLVWGGMIGYLSVTRAPRVAYPMLGLLLAGYLWIATTLFSAQHLWLPLMIPLGVQVGGAVLLSVIWRFRQSDQQRSSITEALSPYAPQTLVEQVIQDSPRQTGFERRFGVCIYTDIVNSSSKTEAVGDEKWAELASLYFDFIFQPAQKRGALLSELAGDSMLAYWTAEDENVELVRDACLAALEIQHIIPLFRHPAIDGPIHSRIGVHCGWLHEGDTRVGLQMRHVIRGHVVNMAARIEALNKPLGTSLLVSGASISYYADIPHLDLGAFLLEGASNSMHIYQIFQENSDVNLELEPLGAAIRAARVAFERRDWHQAEALFRELQERWPDCTPAGYLRRLNWKYATHPPADDWDGSISVRKS